MLLFLARIAYMARYGNACHFFSSTLSCLYFWIWKVFRACLPSVELPVAHWSYRNVVGISLSHESPMWRDMLFFLARIAYMARYGNACNFFSSTLSCLYFWVWKVLRACLPSVELPVAHWSYRNVVGISLSHVSPMWRDMLLFLARIAYMARYGNACNFFSSTLSCLYFWVWKVLRACLPSVELPVAHWSYRNVVGISLSHESPMWRDMLLFLARIAYMARYGNACNFFSSTLSCLYFWVWKV